ncbi:MAG: ABC transporter ATP-binding protein [Mycobacteriales bacterium]
MKHGLGSTSPPPGPAAVSLTVAPGQVVGVIGPNGSGKTTLFNVACGFVRPDAGLLVWRGRRLDRLHPSRLAGLGISRTLQGLGLFSGLTVLENVLVGATRASRVGFATALFGLPRGDREERELAVRATSLLAELDIADAAHRFPGELPYGVAKRVALARALACEPDLLMLDEPASGLSEGEMSGLRDLIATLRSDRGMSVLLVEHHMDLVMAVSDAVVVLDFGRVVAAGTPTEVRADPAVTTAYLGESVSGPGPDRARGTRAEG